MNCRVGKMVGFISARSLKKTHAMNSRVKTELYLCKFPNHCEIVALLEQTEIKKDEKTYHINGKGLSRGHVFLLFKYSRSFAERNNKGTEELDDEGWINNLESFVDVTGHC